MTELPPPFHAVVTGRREDAPYPNTVRSATVDTVVLLDCPQCGLLLRVGPRTGAHNTGMPWLVEHCPQCTAHFQVEQTVKITWKPGGEP